MAKKRSALITAYFEDQKRLLRVSKTVQTILDNPKSRLLFLVARKISDPESKLSEIDSRLEEALSEAAEIIELMR